MLKEISAMHIRDTVCELYQRACCSLGEDVLSLLKKAQENETQQRARFFLNQLLENACIADENQVPLCQDTGMAVIFVDLGQDIHIVHGDFMEALSAGIAQAVQLGGLRASVLHPLTRKNTGDNTPPVVHLRMQPGDQMKITVCPKGFGSENMSRLAMLQPGEGVQGVEDFIVQTVQQAGGNPCPPVVVGVGIGGTMEVCALLAKRALIRPIGSASKDPNLEEMEKRLLARINALGIGPQGLGGDTTALAVHILVHPTHIAGLPVAVNMQCHAARHAEAIL